MPDNDVTGDAARVVRGVGSGRGDGTSPVTRAICGFGQQSPRHERGGVRQDRQAPVDLLVLDVLGARRPDALQHEVEAVFLVVADAVVVDRGAQEFARSRRQRLQHQRSSLAAGSVSVQQRAPLATRTTNAVRPPFSKYCSTA